MNLQTLIDSLGSIGVAALLLFVWRFSSKFTALVEAVNEIKTNHLPHIEAKIDRHIEWHATQGGKK